MNDNLEATIQAAFDKAFHDAGVSLPETIIKQNKVPQGWTDATVGDFASVQTGPFGSQLHNEDYVESGTPIITVEHMDGKYIAHRNLPLVSQNDVDRLRKYDLHTGDIVFSRVGSVDRAVMVSQHEDGWLFSGRCLRVRPYDPNTGSYFLWWFNQPVIRQLVTASAVGATMPSINTSILNSIRIVFPQKDIVTQFCKMADGLIEIIATNLEEIRKLNDAREYIQLSLSR
ncbi:restriction endonuclease subunit S [Pseudoflavonifractor capillosus]|uniref:restriction endonuclease subunit S n=1 Tax=Pseudoflavonifractor capillosus TaxID=106588 RepID=UPI000A0467BD